MGRYVDFSNGVSRVVQEGVQVVGLDYELDLIATERGMLYPLTDCCYASGKGGEADSGVVCRACHDEVDPKYGAVYVAADIAHYVTFDRDCPTCAEAKANQNRAVPRHAGSRGCESGALAAGGTKAHCTCDVCF